MLASLTTQPLDPINPNLPTTDMPLTDEERAAVRARVEANIARIRDENYPIYRAKYREMKAKRDARRAAEASGPQRRGSKDPLSAWNARKEPVKKTTIVEVRDSEDDDDGDAPSTAKSSDYVGFGHEISTQEAYGAGNVAAKRPASNPSRRSEGPLGHKRPKTSAPTGKAIEIPRPSSASASFSKAPPPKAVIASKTEPPEWYRILQVPKSRAKDQANADGALDRLKEEIRKMKKLTASDGARPFRNEFLTIRNYLHALFFVQVDGKLLRAKRMLHNEDGLPQIFDQAFSGGVNWPWDVRADAEELYNKWYHGEFDTDTYRGIVRGKPTKKGKGKSGDVSTAVDKLAPDAERYRLMDVHANGNGKLLNGQWVSAHPSPCQRTFA